MCHTVQKLENYSRYVCIFELSFIITTHFVSRRLNCCGFYCAEGNGSNVGGVLNGDLGVGVNVLILYRSFRVPLEGNISFICIVAFHIALLYWVVGQPDPKRDEVDMTQFLPPNLLALFAPRDPVPYIPPPDKLPHEKKNRGYVGVGCFLHYFEVSTYSLRLAIFTFGVVYGVQGWCRRKDVN